MRNDAMNIHGHWTIHNNRLDLIVSFSYFDRDATHHTASTFGRTIFPGVWDVSVMRHGSQASDEIEDDLYQYNVK